MSLMMAGHASAQVQVKGNVYGGGNLADVQGSVEVNIKAGQIGDQTIDANHGNVYGGGALANTNTDNWDGSALTDDPYIEITISEETDLTGYFTRAGASAPYTYTPATGTASSGTYYKKRETKVNLTGGTIKGDAYGGGLGRLESGTPATEGYLEAKPATEYGDVLVTVAGTQIGTGAGRVFGANNINGTPKGHVKVLVQKTAAVDGQSIDVAAVFGGGNQAAYNPYRATEKAEVEVNMTAGENARLFVGNVFGGGNEAGTENTAGTEVKIMAGNVKTGVYGGCNTSGTVSGDTKVAITGGTIGTAWENAPATFPTLVFGGGLGHETLVNGSVMVELGAMTAAVAPATTPTISGDAIIWGDVYGGSAEGLVNTTGSGSEYSATADKTTSVVFYSGTLNGNLYGGGLGTATHAADVYGDITVNIGTGEVKEGVMITYGNATINGSVFGCNNTNGTPKGDVLVNVYKTAHISSTGDDNNQYQYDTEVDVEDLDLDVESEKRYAIQAVYGGGNLANYTPVALEGSNRHSTTVHVYVCEENTVKAVYGGGNAADVGTGAISANTNVIIEGGRFYNVFGGGNGAGDDNPGANIYGTAKTEIKGGLFNQIFGGSDTKGNVGVVDLTIESERGCLLKVNESFGGANMSDLTGDVITTLTCSDNITIGTFYGGSNQADINGNVTLNVYGGDFKNVFGGSKGKIADANADNEEKEKASADISGNVTLNLYGGNISENAYGGSNINGRIGGKITVNVLDNGLPCALSIDGNIYGAGNVTPYTPTYTLEEGETERISPVVNLIHGTVANVFGGAKGETATVTASPQVNIGYDATTMGDLTTSGTLLYDLTHLSDGTADPNYTSTTQPADFAAVVTGNVYGGGDLAQVTGNTVVNLRKANSSVDNIFGGGNEANVTGSTTVNIIDGTVTHDVYGGGALANVGTSASDATQVTITGGTVRSIYGGGLGQVAAEAVLDDPATTDVDEARPAVSAIAALVNGAVTVTVNGGTVHDVYGCNNVNGAPQGTVTVNINNNVGGNVYGGGNLAAYGGTPTVNILAGTVGTLNEGSLVAGTGNVYGGGNNAGVGGSLVAMSDGTVLGAVYGGCNTSGTVGGTSTVTVTGGTLGTAFASAPASMDAIPNVLFGGGKGANTSVSGTTTLNVGTKSGSTYTGTANIYGNVYGGSENGTIGDVDVNLYANKIYGNVFGGGYDTDASLAPEGTLAKHAPAAGVVHVLLDGTEFDRTYTDNAYLAQVFGCNNKNGTPTGLVTVNVKRTIGCNKSDSSTPIASRNVYDVYAVYGGGNMADYVPSNANDSTFVLIEGCDLTSIQYVYGGGNAAAVPASGVSIKGTYIIDKVFGGGNGAGQVPGPNNTLIDNPGANVGYYINGETKPSYGRGRAVTKLYGGTINEAYGGSNTLGDVRKVIVETKTPEGSTPDCCTTLNVNNVYGAGSEAEMTGDVSLIMECMPEDYVDAVYGGAKNAIINGNVMLVVTSGKYGRVFGGNNAGGSINGTISVVAKEEGCKPLEIGELYGGGNKAPYSKYGCEKDGNNWVPNTSETEGAVDHTIPTGQTTPAPYAIDVLVESCTSIGKVFGGGNEAEVIGDTHVEINMFRGTTDDNPNTLRPIGRIGQVFGGGNLAKVTGKTTVDIGTDGEQEENGSVPEGQKKGVNIASSDQFINPDYNPSDVVNYPERISLTAGIYGGGNAADVVGDTEVNIGTAYQSLGINITGNIFGGGLGETTTVTGNVTVNIGANTGTNESPNYVGYANITGDVYGGSAKGKVNATKGGTAPDVTYTASSGAATQVNFYGGTIDGNLYGGGEGQRAAAGPPAVEAISADVYGPVTVTMEKGSTTNTVVNNVFGCNNFYGAPQNTVNVYINGGTVNQSVYGGGNQAAYSVETNPSKDQANAYKNYPAVNINNGTVTENVFGGGLGTTATVTGNPHVTMAGGEVKMSVYGGGSLASVDGSTNIVVNSGTIGTEGEGGATYGNIYGGGFGSSDNVRIGLVKGNTEVTVNGGTILHNIYGGGAYGSVGTYTYASENANAAISALATANTGKATITILGGTIGTDGDENGMIFGSSRGDIDAPDAIQDNMAWVHDTEVIIGTEDDGENVSTPLIKGSVYGGGENGHTYNNASVTIHSGMVGIASGSDITDNNGTPNDASDDITYSGAAYPYRGNVYGGGCGTDKYYSNPTGVANPHDGKGDTYNQMAGIVRGTTTVLIYGGQVVRNVYGAGAMGSVGATDNTGAIVSGGSTSITISGGTIGVSGVSGSDGDGNVFGAARGNSTTTQQKSVALVKTTGVTISGTADVKGSVYGGGEIGNVGTYTTSADGTNTYPEGSGVCAVIVSGGTVRGNVFGAGKGIADSFTSERAMVNSTSVTISNGSVERNVYGGGEIGRVENNTVVAISAGEIIGNVFGAGQGVDTHGYSGLVRGNSTVTIEGTAKVRQNVYGGGETATVGKYWVTGVNYGDIEHPSAEGLGLSDGMPYATRAGGVCTVNVLGNAQVGPDAGASETVGHVFGAGKGVEPGSYTYEDNDHRPYRMDNNGNLEYFTTPAKYLQFLETLALVSNTDVTIGGNATVKGNVYGGSESGYVQDHTDVKIQGGTIGTTTYGNVYGGGKGLPTFAEAGKVKGATSVAISGGTTNGNVYGGGELGYVQQNVAVTVSGGQVINDVYGGGALADTNTDNWDATKNSGAGGWADGKNDPSTGTTYKTTVNLTGGLVGNAYGGALGRKATDAVSAVAAMVYGDVTVTVNGAKFHQETADEKEKISYTDESSVVHNNVLITKYGRVFGANNANGTPKGDIMVNVKRTVPENGGGHEYGHYEIHSVYGGGNMANYLPADGKNTQVLIEGCDETSIECVYGGGNSASVPQTLVTINGTFEIGMIFGGGNGDDPIKDASGNWIANPGADVIQSNGVDLGTGTINAKGGTIRWLYGGSNKKGRCGHITENLTVDPALNCPLKITNVYGAGKNADVDRVFIVAKCPGENVEYLYGGSYNAHIRDGVTMTLIGGQYKNVFGGNDSGGSIGGPITINIQETYDCDPIIINNLYGGGNKAAYPGEDGTGGAITINVKSCTHIGNIFGGGMGDAAVVNGTTQVNLNMTKGVWATSKSTVPFTLSRDKADFEGKTDPQIMAALEAEMPNIDFTSATLDKTNYRINGCKVKDEIGTIGNVYGGGDEAAVLSTSAVNISSATSIDLMSHNSSGVPVDTDGNAIFDNDGKLLEGKTYNDIAYTPTSVLGAHITGDVFGGGNQADVTGNTYVNICYDGSAKVAEGSEGVKIGGSVYGGGCEADAKSNTFVTMSDGYVFNGIFGGGLAGSVGTVTDRSLVNYDGTTHTSHTGCVGGKPTAFADNTGKCTVVVNGGQIGPVEVATEGMPNPHGWVWGGGCGLIEGPEEDPDADFRTYVKETDVTIGGTAFIMEGVIGGGEFGRVLGNTLVKIQDHCQVGVGYDQKETVNDVLKPKRYADADFIDPTTSTAEQIAAKAAIMPECAHWPYQSPYLSYDPYYNDPKYASFISANPDFGPASTEHPSDGKTWIGVVFGGGSGYMPYEKADGTGYDWCRSAGLVEGDTEVRISGGHILTNVYGGNEITDVKGKCTVTMTGGTIGVPRTLEQIIAHPVTCYLFGAGKGDERSHFYNMTNVGSVEVNVSGGIIYGSVFGGSEDGHVLNDVTVNIQPGAVIGTWGTSYVDGNVFGGGRGFSGTSLTSGNIGGNVTMNITGGTMLGSIYGGGRLGSVGYAPVKSDDSAYGTMQDGDSHGHVTLNITGGTIGNANEFIMPNATNIAALNTALSKTLNTDFTKWTDEVGEWTIWKKYYNVPYTEYDKSNGRLTHTKGGNVFAGGMGRLYALNGSPLENWFKLGKVKSTKLTISGTPVIKGNVYGGGELGQVDGFHTTKNAANGDVSVGTEVIIEGGTIGTEIQDGSTTKYTFGSVFGGGYGSLEEKLTHTGGKPDSYPKYIAGRVKAGTKVNMTAGEVKASVYGGGEMAAVGESKALGETLTEGLTGDTHVIIGGGTIGHAKVGDTYFGGAKMGNVYGGGSGHNNTVRSGHIYGNTNVTITAGTIYHNVYGGGAYGTVGDFNYDLREDPITHTNKVFGILGRSEDHSNSGVATVTITGGTIGIDGHENGMVFGSSRGDVNRPGERDDHTAWVYDTNVIIGALGSGPAIKGSVYGSGENGHTFNNTVVTVNGGTIGVVEDASYPNRGNVYGGGCGTDKYYENHELETHDGNGQLYNALAGIVYGTTTVNVNDGTVVRNVYGAGAMGTVGKADNSGVITSGGTTTIAISGGTIGVSGSVGDGNVFGAARGDENATQTGLALVKTTGVTISGTAAVKGNVYGGGEIGDVQGNTMVDMQGGTVAKNVYGGGKGSGLTFTCEKAMVGIEGDGVNTDGTLKEGGTSVNITNGTVNGNVFGGGEVGRVERNTQVTVGAVSGEGSPDIKGDVFGGGKGLVTHGYSALVRGNTEVTVQGNAKIAENVYGGGEIASVGRYGLNAQKMPNILLAGGECKVTVQGSAVIGPTNAPDKKGNVFGGGKGVDTPYDGTNRRMTLDADNNSVYQIIDSEEAYKSFLETLALTTAPDVTIDGNATINGSVFGGGEIGLTKGEVNVNIKGGTMEKDVYGGGALADTNTTKEHGIPDGNGGYLKDEETGEYIIQELHSVTNVNLLGGHIKGDAFGGALGQRTGINSATSDIPAVVHGDITVTLNGTKFDITHYVDVGYTNVVKSGRVFGCNNLLGSPQGNVTVKVYKTVEGNTSRTNETDKAQNKQLMKDYPEDYKTRTGYVPPSYELAAVYGGGNLAPFEASGKKANVEIYGCNDTSIETVYGGGNAACVPETFVTVWGCYEIGSLFGGGNGKDKYKTDTGWVVNPGADVNGDGDNGTLDGDKWIDPTPGNATTWLYGGTVHDAYGGSDTKGTVTGSVFIDVGDPTAAVAAGQVESCPLDVGKIVGAGKNADVDGDLIVIMGCKPPTYIPLVYGGADNANVKGKVELTLTSGNFGKVFGGNNLGGAILGHIQLNIEETGDCATPLTIEELYLGGNQAAYSAYGYYVKTTTSEGGGGRGATTETPELKDDKLQLMPRKSADDPHLAVKTFDKVAKTWTVYTGEGDDKFTIDAHPELNIISCTSIGQVYGGGLGARADMYANPTVNINMIKGSWAGKTYGTGETAMHIPDSLGKVGAGYIDTQNIEHEGGVFGGGNEATVHGNTTVNIGTATTVKLTSISDDDSTPGVDESIQPVEGANIVSNVYGGGNLANVTGNTYVNVCAVKDDNLATTDVIEYKGVSITGTDYEGVTIKGNVFGGGKGIADSFTCAKAMVGEVDTNDGNTVITKESIDKGTRVNIGNGTIEGTVYGGGEIGRVEWNSVVTVGLPITSGTSAPVITGDVYGAGKGVEQYGYAALVRGNTFVTIQADAKVGHCVYGGGEISSVGKYTVNAAGIPTSLANSGSGYCNVIVRGNAEIGPNDMKMTADGGPDDFGHVFGAGRGILPYENETLFECKIHPGQKHPGRMAPPDGDHPDGVWECFYDTESGKVDEDKYLTFIETQGLATQTDVTIGGNAFVKGSVYGGSMDGHVQHHTHVTIADDCQIGAGYDTSTGHSLPKYTGWPTDASSITTSWAECAHWPYEAPYAPYDKFATYLYEGKYYFDEEHTQSAEGGALIASDGHTWYGNVFGGGSGVIPYKPGKWHRAAGSVGGNATVDITGGHILTSVYGGNENTDVGTYTNNDKGELIVWQSGGKCTVNMTGGTLGVPRTDADAAAHPVTCYLFGAGKGDQRIFFNTWTNVQETEVNVKGGIIYGSVFGGGEDGHVLGNAAVTIGKEADHTGPKIGTTGTSYVDGNVFGGGRGFSGVALTAGSTGGNVTMNIYGGTMQGSVYGGGRLASVGIDFTPATSPLYGLLVDDTADKTHGHISITISGGTIGNGTTESGAGHPVSGNVFGGSMGRITLLDGSLNPLWPKQAVAKLTEVTVSGGTIYNSVYGGSEFGIVRNRAKVNVSGTADIRGNVFGGGYGSDDQNKTTIVAGGYASIPTMHYTFTPMIWTGCVSGDTEVNISGGKIGKNVYGGGNFASVGLMNFNSNEAGTVYNYITKHESLTDGFGLSWPYKFEYIAAAPNDLPAIGGGAVGGKTTVTVTGGRIGTTAAAGYGNVYGGSKGLVTLKKADNTTLITDVNEQRYAEAFCANVRETEVTVNYASTPESDDGSTTECIVGAVYGGGQDGHVYEDANVSITGGLIGLSVYGGGQGESTFMGKLRDQSTKNWKDTTEPINSITAGKVYGNTSVIMSGGLVVGHVYGGGNLASVGKGNYAGGKDDYYPAGYGETLTGNLWDDVSDNSKAFLSSGNVTVSITGGQVGTLNGTSGTVFGTSEVTPTGMVFGGSRGRSAQDVMLDPRHEYAPDFYLGYVNTTSVTIGNASGGPRICSQVFGGGRDGHVRNSSHVIVNNGTIGQTYAETTAVDGSTADYQRYHRGNVYGSGSGLGMWDTVHHGMSSGSVTRNTTVDINGGTIYNNVYGGGALSSVGPPKLDPEKDYAASTWSKCVVNINGGTIGDPTVYNTYKYGGCVYGASRGNDFAAGESTKDFATVLWTDVNITGGTIAGNVYGGGATGDVKCNTDVSMTGGTVGHDVFGGGKGDGTLFDCSKAMVGIEGDGAGKEPDSDENKDKGTSVTISNGTVNGNVYGGGEVGRVEWNTQVTVGAVSGSGTPKVEGSVFGAGKGLETHGYSALVRGNSTVTVQGTAKIGHNVYGGGEMATVGRYWVKGKNTTDPNTGQPFDDATPIPEDLPDGMPYKQQSGGICSVTIQGNADIGYNGAADDAGHVFGAGQGVVPHFSDTPKPQKKVDDGVLVDFADEAAYFEFLETLALVTNANVTINGANVKVNGNVYGGSESGFVQHDTYVTIQDGTIGKSGSTTYGKVFGGGKGLSLSSTTFTEAGKVKENTRVDILGGIVYSDVYGGGALGKSNTNVVNNAYPTATVNLKGGVITGSAYGGGLGDATTAANVGNTILHLNEGLNPNTTKGCIVNGYIFGANNVNGTPLGHALVHIHATQNADADKDKLITKYPEADNKYDVEGVFGGGNASDYVPASTDAKQSTEVIIEGCDLTSIREVYGGGYGAAVPATDVLIRGTYLIDNVFGGGYGYSATNNHTDPSAPNYNPGANVGTLTGGGAYGETVTGKTNVKLMAGRIHHVYGASNTKGDILGGSSITTVEKPDEIDCNLIVDDIFGGGNEAPMVGGTEVVLGCMPGDWIEEVYAGSQSADVGAGAVVGADVSLTITSGKFGRVFGGNKSSGIINGGIEVHIEENPDCDTPIIIGELYAGGNMAPYSAYGYDSDGNLLDKDHKAHDASPVVVHAKAFTSIGKIFGGGKGAEATLIGNPWVLVDEVESEKTYEGDNTTTTLENGLIKKTLSDDTEVTLYPRTSTGTMGVVGTIFGGGNEAPVEGNTTVKIATNEYVVFWSAPTLDDVRGFYTRSRENDESPYVYTKIEGADAVAPTPGTIYYKKVLGADIRGNVYGGGNNAEVTGDTNVVIGKKEQ